MLVPVKNVPRRIAKQGRWTLVQNMFDARRYLRLGYYGSAHDSCAALLWSDWAQPTKKRDRIKYEWHILCQGPEFSNKITFEKSGFLSGNDADKASVKAAAMKAAEADFDAATQKYDRRKKRR